MHLLKSNKKPVPMSHICNYFCLGPLAFDHQNVGKQIQLSQGYQLATRAGSTFRNGLVFSNRPIRIQERIHLRVMINVMKWEGALRVGFTSIPPSARNLPLPSMAIPDLTKCPGHWATPLPEFCCQAGSELKFWVSAGGTLYFADKNNRKHELLSGVDISKQLWFMLDIYGQTSSIFLLGSKKKGFLGTRRSCPTSGPEPSSLDGHREDSISCLDNILAERSCVVCLSREATVTLPCAHQCLCQHCFPKFLQEYDFCPLCRTKIDSSSAELLLH